MRNFFPLSTGPLIHLSPLLALELRLDAQRAASERTEDVSLTWKLLGAAESFGRFFSDESGFSEDIKAPSSRRRPEDLFELKQRDQLKKALSSLRAPLIELVEKANKEAAEGDLLAGLPRDLSRQFARVRASVLTATSEANSLVVRPANQEGTSSQPRLDGSIQELCIFINACESIERTGAWVCLDAKARQEVIAFSTSHSMEIQKHVRNRCKEMSADASVGQTNLLDDLLGSSKPSKGYTSSSGTVPPLLPPPPSSSCSVGRSPWSCRLFVHTWLLHHDSLCHERTLAIGYLQKPQAAVYVE